MLEGRIGETHISVSRGPQTFWLSGQRWKSEIIHWACHRHLFMAELFLLLVRQNRHLLLSVVRVFSLLQGNQRSVFHSSLDLSESYLASLRQSSVTFWLKSFFRSRVQLWNSTKSDESTKDFRSETGCWVAALCLLSLVLLILSSLPPFRMVLDWINFFSNLLLILSS